MFRKPADQSRRKDNCSPVIDDVQGDGLYFKVNDIFRKNDTYFITARKITMKRSFILLISVLVLLFPAGTYAKDAFVHIDTSEDIVQSNAKDTFRFCNEKDEDVSAGEPKTEGVPLLEFCNSKELEAWYVSALEELPVSLECWVFGEAPYAMETTDPELIREIMDALQAVTIGGLSEIYPPEVDDAPGYELFFEMEDGSKKGFIFENDSFSMNNNYYDVFDYGNLDNVIARWSDIWFS